MLDFETAIELLKKYGYSSTSVHPYIYQSGDSVGICYTYVDEDFGNLERIKIFETPEEMEDFLKKIDWLKKNGLKYHVRMILDNYESINPKTLFLRNEKTMIEGEMDDIDNFDIKERARNQMDPVSQLLYEAGDLLLVYDEIKKRQMEYFKSIIGLKNTLRQKYYDLQKEVDTYNKVKINRHLTLLPEVADASGIDQMMEIALKDRYNMYIAQLPTYEEAVNFVKEVWNLNKNLELNSRYYDAVKEETDIRNEFLLVDKKIETMKTLNDSLKPLFGTDVVGKFRKINKAYNSTISSISTESIQNKMDTITNKYKYFDKLNLLYTSDYLREAFQNSNYEDLAIKYGTNTTQELASKSRTPLNEVASSLFVQYKRLTPSEQAMLTLYNNPKYRKIIDAILAIPKYENFTVKQIIRKISSIKGYSKIKSECYDVVKNRINDPMNANIKNGIFAEFDFTTYDSFISSMVNGLNKLRNVNNKMVLNGDINMYLTVNKVNDITKNPFIMVTNDINSILAEAKENNCMVGITLLKANLPVLYSPYYLDLGDIYTKGASPKMEIKEMITFELLVETSDITISIDNNKVTVVKYYSEPEVDGNLYIVREIKAGGKTVFCKYAFTNNLGEVPTDVPTGEEVTQAPVVEEQPVEEQPVVEEAPVVEEKKEDAPPPVEPLMAGFVASGLVPEAPKEEEKKEEVPAEAPVEEKPVEELKVEEKPEEVKQEVPEDIEVPKLVEEQPEELVKPEEVKKEEPVVEEKKEVPEEPKVEVKEEVKPESVPEKEEEKALDIPDKVEEVKKEEPVKPKGLVETTAEELTEEIKILEEKELQQEKPNEISFEDEDNTVKIRIQGENKMPVEVEDIKINKDEVVDPVPIKPLNRKEQTKEVAKDVKPEVKPATPVAKPTTQVVKPVVKPVAKPGVPTTAVKQVVKPVTAPTTAKPVTNVVAKPAATNVVTKPNPVAPGAVQKPVQQVVQQKVIAKPNVVQRKIIAKPAGQPAVKIVTNNVAKKEE